MPLYIKREGVDELAEKYMALINAESKAEAVERALKAQIEVVMTRKPLLERLEPILLHADGVGQDDPAFDMKKFTDDMWDGT